MDKKNNPKRNRESQKADIERLKKDVKENPDLYQYESARKFKVSQSTMWRELKRIRVTYKKNVNSSQRKRRKAYYILKESRGV